MTAEIGLWVLGVAAIPLLVWCIGVSWFLKEIRLDTKRIMVTQETVREKLSEVKENTLAIKELTHYLKWFTEQQTGQEPPPPLKD